MEGREAAVRGASEPAGPEVGPDAVGVVESITIGRPRAELFLVLRRPGILARVATGMKHVERLPGGAAERWAIRGHLGRMLTIEAEPVEAIPEQRIVLQSPAGAASPVAASIQLADAPGARGTEVRVVARYAPRGFLGRVLDRLLLPAPREIVRGALRRLRMLVETGEIATIEGQPVGRGARRGG